MRFSFGQPVPVPSSTSNTALVTALASLNASLQVWNYCEHPQEEFLPSLKETFSKVKTTNGSQLKDFVKEKFSWLNDGLNIILSIDLILSDKVMDGMTIASPMMHKLYLALSKASMNVQFMCAAVEARLELLCEAHPDLLLTLHGSGTSAEDPVNVDADHASDDGWQWPDPTGDTDDDETVCNAGPDASW